MAPDAQAQLSDDEDIRNAHIPKVNLRQDWWKPLKEERPATLKPAWSISSSDPPTPAPPAGLSGASGSPGASGSSHVPPPPPLLYPPTKETMTDTRLRPSVSLTPSDLQMDDDMAPDTQAQSSDDEDIENAHISKVNLWQD
nr:hypothetical protein [Tanacetum cinerariifolium]